MAAMERILFERDLGSLTLGSRDYRSGVYIFDWPKVRHLGKPIHRKIL